MKNFLLRVTQNPKVRQAFMALLLAVLAALGISGTIGCGGASVPPAVAARLAVLECQRSVLEAVVPAYVAEDLVMAARAGNGEYVVRQLLGLGLAPADVAAAADEFHKCDAPEPSLDAGAPVLPSVERG